MNHKSDQMKASDFSAFCLLIVIGGLLISFYAVKEPRYQDHAY